MTNRKAMSDQIEALTKENSELKADYELAVTVAGDMQKRAEAAETKLAEAQKDTERKVSQLLFEVVEVYGVDKWERYKSGSMDERGNPRLEGMSDATDELLDLMRAALNAARGQA